MTTKNQSARAGDGTPAGFALVPKDPTEDMLRAAVRSMEGNAVYKSVELRFLKEQEENYAEVWAAMLAAAPRPSAKLEDFCGVMQEIRETETACGTKHRIAKWTCPKCSKACSTLELDGEWCHGDGLCISFINGERIVGCTSCWLAAVPAVSAPAEPYDSRGPTTVEGWRSVALAGEKERDWLRERLKTVDRHQGKDCWYWQNDGEDHLESMTNALPVVIRADHLRELLKQTALNLCDRTCEAIHAADDKSMAEAGYMLDCNDCCRIVRDQFAATFQAPATVAPAEGGQP